MSATHTRIRLLLVEDDEPFLMLIKQMLARANSVVYEVIGAPSLQSAIDRLSQSAFDIALLDLNLPDSSGFETFVRFHAGAGEMPIIVLSGVTDEQMAA
jgi:DNA-binding response OmpR family regulator